MPKSYTCDCCKQSFDYSETWTQEDADKEAVQNFGHIPEAEQAIVCDDCYKKIMNQRNES